MATTSWTNQTTLRRRPPTPQRPLASFCELHNTQPKPTTTIAACSTAFVSLSARHGRGVGGSALNRRAWSAEEDDAIRKLVGKHGTPGWTFIAENLALLHKDNHGRSGKQCWERWHNHLGEFERDSETKKDKHSGSCTSRIFLVCSRYLCRKEVLAFSRMYRRLLPRTAEECHQFRSAVMNTFERCRAKHA